MFPLVRRTDTDPVDRRRVTAFGSLEGRTWSWMGGSQHEIRWFLPTPTSVRRQMHPVTLVLTDRDHGA